jgi:hypothetical protein
MIQCEECICLAVCINQVTFNKNTNNEFGYTMQFNGLIEKCVYFGQMWHSNQYEYYKIKLFFLQQQGLIQNG